MGGVLKSKDLVQGAINLSPSYSIFLPILLFIFNFFYSIIEI